MYVYICKERRGVGGRNSGSKKENYAIWGFVIVGILARLLFGKVALIVYLAVLGIIFLKAVLSFVLQGAIGLGSVVVGYLIAGIMVTLNSISRRLS